MASDRSWIGRNRFNESKYLTEEYKAGVDRFIEFAIKHSEKKDNGLIKCAGRDCGNKYFKKPSTVKNDLYRYGIMQWYTTWDCHGEKNISQVEVGTSSGYRDDDMYDAHDEDDFDDCEDFEKETNETAKQFYKMVNTASEPIYPNNTNYTTLEFSMKLLEWKNKHNCSNNGFDDLLHLIGLVLPDDHKLPEKYYNMWKMIKGLHMEYEKIDACENDCMLFYKEHSGKTKCDICNGDRYQKQKDPKKQKIPRKILRYFPIIMRLQRLFMVETTAKAMRWHHDRIAVEGELSHPADGDEWKNLIKDFKDFQMRFEM
ncbi:uncharacterized protein LOC141714071 [Apium graveolens]|uniref:uncharacterized protein LOC141714071 n=1 Tax=Apium graveolens TaxID=4045 RepID=UPI003D7B0116